MQNMLNKQNTLIQIAKENQLASIEYKQAMVEDEVPTDFAVGSLVFRHQEGKPNKLSAN
jgi:hypothetical protein